MHPDFYYIRIYYNSSNSLRTLRKPQYIMKLGDIWCWPIIGDLRYISVIQTGGSAYM